MKHWQIAFIVALSTSLALAEDFKTVTGKEYKNATITRVEGDGIVLRTKTGISKVYFVELPKDVHESFVPLQRLPVQHLHRSMWASVRKLKEAQRLWWLGSTPVIERLTKAPAGQ